MKRPLVVILCAVVLSALLPARPLVPPTGPATEPFLAGDSLTRQPQIRKLHLVRPDLILYPIAHEVIC